MKKYLFLFGALAVLVGCSTMFTGVVTLTSVVDTAMKAWADASHQGLTSPAVDQKIEAAHDKYRAAAGVAKQALIAYKASGDAAQYHLAWTAAGDAASQLVGLIAPLIAPAKATSIQNNLKKATVL